MAIKCFNDLFKVQYCLSNAYTPYSDCCMKNGITHDTPDKPGKIVIFLRLFKCQLKKCILFNEVSYIYGDSNQKTLIETFNSITAGNTLSNRFCHNFRSLIF